MLRAPCELPIRPRVLPIDLEGALSMGVFDTFKNSPRISRFWFSTILKCFEMLKSTVWRPGPRTVPTPQVPKPEVGATYEAGSNH